MPRHAFSIVERRSQCEGGKSQVWRLVSTEEKVAMGGSVASVFGVADEDSKMTLRKSHDGTPPKYSMSSQKRKQHYPTAVLICTRFGVQLFFYNPVIS
jgi:hypothetical protein